MSKQLSRLLVIGGGGYLGRALVDKLKADYRVTIFSRSGSAGGDVKTIMGDVGEIKQMEKAFEKDAAVIYLATENKSQIYADHYRANVVGLKNALILAKKYGCPRFIYVSTTMVIKKQKGVVDEKRIKFRSNRTGNLYVDSKTEGVKMLKKFLGLRTVTIYPPVIVNRDFKYRRPMNLIDKIKERFGLLTQGGVMAMGQDRNRNMSYVFIDQLAGAVEKIVKMGKPTSDYVLVTETASAKNYVKKAKVVARFFPVPIPAFIFKKLIGEGQFNLLHDENKYDPSRLKKLLVNSRH